MKKITFKVLLIFLIRSATAGTVYIDPGYQGTDQDGSKNRPYNSWSKVTLLSGNSYLQKRNSVYSSTAQIFISAKQNIKIGAYGTGVRPSFQYQGTGGAIRIESSDNITISDFEINGNNKAHSLIYLMGSTSRYQQNITVNFCSLKNASNPNNAGFGVYAFYTSNLKVLNTYIYHVALDGMYCRYCPDIEIGYCSISDINRRYFENADQKYSSGDGIQLDGYYNGFHIHHTIIQRNNLAGNKFGVIIASAPGVSDNATGIIEYCTFTTDQTVTTALHIERGSGIIVRYCNFEGVTQGIRIGGQYCKNTHIYQCLFENCSRGIGVGATYPGGYPSPGTVVSDNIFINIDQYHIWTDKSTVTVSNNSHAGKPGSIVNYNYGGGKFVNQ